MTTKRFIESIESIKEHSVVLFNGEECVLKNSGMTQSGLYHLFENKDGMFRIYKKDVLKMNAKMAIALFNSRLTRI